MNIESSIHLTNSVTIYLCLLIQYELGSKWLL